MKKSVEDILAAVRNSDEFRSVRDDAARGARAYLEAFQFIAHNSGKHTPKWLIHRDAWEYLRITADPPLNAQQEAAADEARRLIKRFS